MIDKNLFLYDLAIVAIFKDEGRYLKEWLDYHLLAGVEHFYLYNNDSSDDYKEVLAPYVEKNLVTLTDFPGDIMQRIAYNDAIEKYRFECRYMAFIDIDEFIFPKTNRSIVEVIDEILSGKESAAGLGINWQIFGSNGQEKADYSRGVLERFTRRALRDACFLDGEGKRSGNTHVKTVANPRFIRYMASPHTASYFEEKFAVNSNGERMHDFYNYPVLDDRIVVNHYCVKSREEFKTKNARGRSDTGNRWPMEYFNSNDRNEVFDDGILKYRAARVEKFSFESDEQRINRVINALFKTLTQPLPAEDDREFFFNKPEIFLTCHAVAEKFQLKIDNRSAEEYALTWIYQIFNQKHGVLTYADLQLFVDVLPEIIFRPFPIAKDVCKIFSERFLPIMINSTKISDMWTEYKNLRNLKKLLDSI